MEKPKFSVAMSVYGKDNPEWFRTAVESILNQTCPPDEVVLVVDGPVPESLDTVIRDYEQKTIFQVVRLPENRGHGEARRCGLENCDYELIAIMDADDISAPDRFEKQLEIFKKYPGLSVVGGNITEFVDNPANIIGAREVCLTNAEIQLDMKKRCPMNQMTVMFRKQDVERAGGYMDWFCNEDYYLWIRMLLSGASFANIPEYLVNVRVGKDMYQRRGGWKYFSSEARLQSFMHKKKLISTWTYIINVTKRLIVQVLLPNRMRSWVFQKFARKAV